MTLFKRKPSRLPTLHPTHRSYWRSTAVLTALLSIALAALTAFIASVIFGGWQVWRLLHFCNA